MMFIKLFTHQINWFWSSKQWDLLHYVYPNHSTIIVRTPPSTPKRYITNEAGIMKMNHIKQATSGHIVCCCGVCSTRQIMEFNKAGNSALPLLRLHTNYLLMGKSPEKKTMYTMERQVTMNTTTAHAVGRYFSLWWASRNLFHQPVHCP